MPTISLTQPGTLTATDAPAVTPPPPGHALVRVHRVGICGTDYHAFRGKQPFFSYPRILGHELGVEILAVTPPDHVEPARPRAAFGPSLAPGDRCAVEPYLNCGTCIACRRGRPNCCANLKVLGVHTDGGMRDSLHVPLDKLHKGDRLTYDQLALVETLGIGAHAVHRAAPEPHEHALVIGAGPIGLSVVQFLQLVPCHITLLDTSPARLAAARTLFPGIAHTLDPAATDPLDALRQITGGDLPTLVFDATGNPASMNASFRYCGPTARLTFVGLHPGDVTFPDPDFHRRELTLLATRNSAPADFRRIISLIEQGRIDTTPWITHRIPSSALCDTFPTLLDPASNVLKALVEF